MRQSVTQYGVQRAVSELESILAPQWRTGMLPHIRFVPDSNGYRPDAADWGVPAAALGSTGLRTSGITQPPIVGLCAWDVFNRLSAEQQAQYRRQFLALARGLEAYHAWLFRERDPHREGLVCCVHPWETGTDNSPAFDDVAEATRKYLRDSGISISSFGRADIRHVPGPQRPTERNYTAYFGLIALFKLHRYDQRAILETCPFLVQDVLFNCLLCVSLRSLGQLQEALATAVPECEREFGVRDALHESAARNMEAAGHLGLTIRRKFWHSDDSFFYDYDLREGKQLRVATASGFAPLLAKAATSGQVNSLIGALANPATFGSTVPVPSTSLSSPHFDPLRYWSGPTWPVTNWLIVRGLRESGDPRWRQLASHTMAMLAEGEPEQRALQEAARVMERHSIGEEFTTPSLRQYAHAWLWDSAIAAVGWLSVTRKPPLPHTTGKPSFAEYFDPGTGAPLGAAPMTWSAAIYLELEVMLGCGKQEGNQETG